MIDCLIVGLGGFIGSIARYLISKIPMTTTSTFPLNTFIINLIGAFAIGCIVASVAKNNNVDPRLILFLKVGICGGFTTFSTFALETSELIKSGSSFIALCYVISSSLLGIFAIFFAQYLIK